MKQDKVKALVLAGFGMNCDLETEYAFKAAGAEADRVHVNELLDLAREGRGLSEYHILAVGGGFAWADDHGAGVLLALKLKSHLGGEIERFIGEGRLVIGICNGFQALVNMGLLPGFGGDYQTRSVAVIGNECGNFRDQWVNLRSEPGNRCVFTQGVETIDLPVGTGKASSTRPNQSSKNSAKTVRWC